VLTIFGGVAVRIGMSLPGSRIGTE